MSDIIQDVSEASLVTAMEGNLFGLFEAFRSWPRAEVHDEPGMLWTLTDVPFSLFNSVLRARLASDRIDGAIEAVKARAAARHVPLLWWTGPATQPADLERHLLTHGFSGDDHSPGMAIDLAHLDPGPPMPPGLTVERVTDDATLMQWSQVCGRGFGTPDLVADAFHDFMTFADPHAFQAYLGWLNGEPVSTSLLVLAAGVAGIYNVATVPQARRQGIGAILTLAPLRDARDRKCRIGILQATEMGAPVYRSLGFREYCKIGQYEWTPGEK